MSKDTNNLDSIIDNLTQTGKQQAMSKPADTPVEVSEDRTEELMTDPDSDDPLLWKEFINMLELPSEQSNIGCRKYEIDDDIIFTLQQCDFGKPNVQVINSILRTFLISNIEKLKSFLVKRQSLFDKYNT
ncbi:MAG: hypothetical protein NC095_09780 [Muribaculum sp.]|nr:hypothetical protein [Muribaculum sp.]